MCGWITQGNSNFQWFDFYQGREKYAWDCDFPVSNDIRVVAMPLANETCFTSCMNEPKCTSYSFLPRTITRTNKIYDCYLKTGKSPIANPFTGNSYAYCSMIVARI